MLRGQDLAETTAVAGPPRGLAVLACAASLGSVALGPASAWQVHAAGYALVLLLTVAVALFRREDLRRRPSPVYVPSVLVHRAVAAALAIGLLATGWHAYLVATELAK